MRPRLLLILLLVLFAAGCGGVKQWRVKCCHCDHSHTFSAEAKDVRSWIWSHPCDSCGKSIAPTGCEIQANGFGLVYFKR